MNVSLQMKHSHTCEHDKSELGWYHHSALCICESADYYTFSNEGRRGSTERNVSTKPYRVIARTNGHFAHQSWTAASVDSIIFNVVLASSASGPSLAQAADCRSCGPCCQLDTATILSNQHAVLLHPLVAQQ